MNKQGMSFEIKAVKDDGFFSGYASVFDVVDSYGDVVRKGAFEETIKEWQAKNKMPPVLWNHSSSEPIGLYTSMKEDDYGLYVEGQLLVNDVPRAKQVHALMAKRVVDGLSIGFRSIERSYNDDDTVNLLKLRLFEVSVVTFPANDDTRIDAVKSLVKDGEIPTLPEFERFLRDAGFSKSQATAIASHGLRKMRSDSDIDGEAEKALKILRS